MYSGIYHVISLLISGLIFYDISSSCFLYFYARGQSLIEMLGHPTPFIKMFGNILEMFRKSFGNAVRKCFDNVWICCGNIWKCIVKFKKMS